MKAKAKTAPERRRFLLPILLCLLAAILLLTGWMWVNAHITHLCHATVELRDLPASLDGVKVLFISDIDIRNAFDDAFTANFFAKLTDTKADILILGGDFTAESTFASLNGEKTQITAAENFLKVLKTLEFPMGKYAVLGENDNEATEARLASAGVQVLRNSAAAITNGKDTLYIAGLSGAAGMINWSSASTAFRSGDAVLAVIHDPELYRGIRTSEVSGGGAWADLVLAGHTLGGQIVVFGRSVFSQTEEEKQYSGGWYDTKDVPLLVSQGLGCKGVGLRLGSQSQIHLLCLRCASLTENDGDA